jgi:hypothetical protein
LRGSLSADGKVLFTEKLLLEGSCLNVFGKSGDLDLGLVYWNIRFGFLSFWV